MTNMLQTHWKWRETRNEAVLHGAHRYNTVVLVRLDAKKAFDVAKLGIIAEVSGDEGA